MTLIPISDRKVLALLNKAGKIQWPIDHNINGVPFTYCDSVDEKYRFEHEGTDYELKFMSGCFYPFLFKVVQVHVKLNN